MTEINMSTAIKLTGRSRNEILAAYRSKQVRGRVKRTVGNRVYGYYFDRASVQAWMERSWDLDAQRRGIEVAS